MNMAICILMNLIIIGLNSTASLNCLDINFVVNWYYTTEAYCIHLEKEKETPIFLSNLFFALFFGVIISVFLSNLFSSLS